MSGLLPVGTLVQVTPFPVANRDPFRGIVRGYDMHHTKYQIGAEYLPGQFSKGGSWAFPEEVEQIRICTDHRAAYDNVAAWQIWAGQRIVDKAVFGRGAMPVFFTRLVHKNAYRARTGTGEPKKWRVDVTGDCYVTGGTLPVIGRY